MRLFDRLREWRNRKIADPDFRRKIATFPLSRPISNYQANSLFHLTAGFAFSQILYFMVHEGLIGEIAETPRTSADLAAEHGFVPRKLNMMLEAAAGLGLIAKTSEGKWTLADFGAVIHGDPGITAMIEHHAMLYEDLASPEKLLQSAAPDTLTRHYWSYATSPDPASIEKAAASPYSELMRVSQAMLTEEVIDTYSLGKHNRVLDVGGGDGAFLAAVGNHNPDVHLSLFDLPPVAERAKTFLAEKGMSNRSDTYGGSFFDTALPEGNDLITLIRIVCDHDDDNVLRLLRNIRKVMRPADTLLIAEAMAAGKTGESLSQAYFNAYFLAMGSGKCRSPEEIFSLLKTAGFSQMRFKPGNIRLITGLIIAKC